MKRPAILPLILAFGLTSGSSVEIAQADIKEDSDLPQVRIRIVESRVYPQILERQAGPEMAELRQKRYLRGDKARTLLAVVQAIASAGNPVVRGHLTLTTQSGIPAQVRVGKKTEANLLTVYTPRVIDGRIELAFRFTAEKPGKEPTKEQIVEQTMTLSGAEQVAVRLPDSDPVNGEHLYWISASRFER